MAEFLEWNAQPENATYAYDFFRDNCATKVIAVLQEVSWRPIRRGMRADGQHLPRGVAALHSRQSLVGVGHGVDSRAEASTAMPDCGHSFLPDVLAYQIDAMTLDGQPLAFEREVVFPHQGSWHAGLPEGDSGRQTPVYLMWGWAAWMALVLRMAYRGADGSGGVGVCQWR